LLAASRAFASEELSGISRRVKEQQITGHFAPVFGACAACLGLGEADAARLVLFFALRGLVSAAVRLGIIGPLEGQAVQWRLSRHAESCVSASVDGAVDDAAQTAPLLDLIQGSHDRLYSRLFQS
jgi:urease accessory protein